MSLKQCFGCIGLERSLTFQKKERGGDGEERREIGEGRAGEGGRGKIGEDMEKKQCLWREGTRCGPIQRAWSSESSPLFGSITFHIWELGPFN